MSVQEAGLAVKGARFFFRPAVFHDAAMKLQAARDHRKRKQHGPSQPYVLRVLAFLLDRKDDNGESYWGIPKMALHCNMSERELRMCLRELERAKLLVVIVGRGPNPKKTNLYRLADDVQALNDEGAYRQVLRNALIDLSPIDVAVLLGVLAEHDDRTCRANVSITDLMRLAGVGRRLRVMEALETLARLEFVFRVGNCDLVVTDRVVARGGLPVDQAVTLARTKERCSPSLSGTPEKFPSCPPARHQGNFSDGSPGAAKGEKVSFKEDSFAKGILSPEGREEKNRQGESPRPVPFQRPQTSKPARQPQYPATFEAAWESHPRGSKHFAWVAWQQAGLDSDHGLWELFSWFMGGMKFSTAWREQDGRFIPNLERLIHSGDWRRVDANFRLGAILCSRVKRGYYGPEFLENARDGVRYAMTNGGMSRAEVEKLILERAQEFASSQEFILTICDERRAREADASHRGASKRQQYEGFQSRSHETR